MINHSLTAVTKCVGFNGVPSPLWAKDCKSVVTFRIACAYVLFCTLYLPVAFTEALIDILCISIFLYDVLTINMIVLTINLPCTIV